MRILFIKLGAIGDVVQAGVAVKEYLRHNPAARIDWVVGRSVAPLVEAFAVADRVIAIDDVGLLTRPPLSKLRALSASILRLAFLGKYDRVVTAYADPRYRLLSLGVRASARSRFHPNAGRPSPLAYRNRVHEYWRLLANIDAEAIDIAAATGALGAGLLDGSTPNVEGGLPASYVAIAAGGAKNNHRDDPLRRWPVERYLTVGERLLADGRHVVLVGGPSDGWISETFARLPVTNLIGKTSLVGLIPVLDSADVVVTNDSGIMHLSSLTRSGLIALFGPTPANACIPFGRRRTIALDEGNRISCSPCYDGRNYAVCSRNRCLEAISVDRVMSAIYSISSEPKRA